MEQEDAAPAAAPRMAMKQMVLENFKSYAGRRVIGPFHKSFSSIVGPNGSGKSNVIDALLFVFGRRATSMRLKKIAELIHSSARHKDLPFCRVAVHFHDIVDDAAAPDGFTVVPGSELVISREADRDGKSKYAVNGRASNFKEVTALLRAKGVDLDNNRFLILQGEVEQISLMKPKALQEGDSGLLEYLEDIVGTNVYVAEIEKKAALVEQLGDARQEKLQRVKIVQKERAALEGAKAEAEDYLAKRGEVDVLNAHRYQHNEWRCADNARKAEANAEELAAQLEHETAKLGGGEERLKELEERYRRAKAEQDEVEAASQAAHAEYAVFERSDAKAGEDLKHFQGTAKKAEAALKRHAARRAQLEKAIAEGGSDEEERLRGLAEQLAARRDAEEERLEALYEGLKEKTGPVRLELEARQKEMIPLQAGVNDERQRLDVVRRELALYDEKAAAGARRLAEAEKAASDAEQAAAAGEAEIGEAARAAKEAEARLPAARRELEQTTAKEQELAGVRQKLASQTEGARAALRAHESRGKALKAIMKEARSKSSALGGRVYGRLGELGSVERKYDVAVSTAVPQLKNIVVETAVVGQRCCDFLRRHQLGRATFTILDKLQGLARKMDEEVATPLNLKRLYDVVTVQDERFRPAFFQAMSSTLVAKDLDEAVRAANAAGGRRWRVVTLAGQVVDASGTMSGGGGKAQSGAMRVGSGGGGRAASSSSSADDLDVDPRELGVLEKRLAATEKELAAVRARRRELEKEVAALERAVGESATRARKIEMAAEDARAQLADFGQRLEDLRAEQAADAGADEEAVQALRAREAAADKAVAAAQRKCKKLEGAIEELQQAILDAGGSELRTQKAKVERLSADADKTSKQLTKLGVDRANNEKKLAKLEAAVAKTEAELAETRERLEELAAERESNTEKAMVVLKAYKRAQKEAKKMEADMAGVTQEHEAAKKEVAVVRTVIVNNQNALDNAKAKARENARQAADWRRKLNKIKAEIQRTRTHLAGLADEDDEDDEEEEKKKEGEEATHEGAAAAAAAAAGEEKEEEDDGMKRKEKSGKAEADDSDDDGDEKMEEDGDDQTATAKKKSAKPASGAALVLEYEELSEEEAAAVDMADVEYRIATLEQTLTDLSPNMAAIEEYRQKNREYMSRVQQLDAITQERDRERKVYEALRKKRLDEFMAAFTSITMKLKEMYQMLTLGGDAELELVDSIDPFSEGIVFSVRPPKKSWKNIQNLSGGEKTLSSLALVFALHHFKPTPLYVMDEIDAALDFKNVSIVANYIKERTKNAQFVIISLRNNMFELADRLVGIYKTHDVTKSITIDPHQFTMAPPSADAPPAAASSSSSSSAAAAGAQVSAR